MKSSNDLPNRREFLHRSFGAGVGLMAGGRGWAAEAGPPRRKFTLCLACGPINVNADPRKLPEWAARYGFESIEPPVSFLGGLSDAELAAYQAELKERGLVWGAAGLGVEFRRDDAAFEKDLGGLPAFARTLQRAGVARVATWLSPGHRSLTYLANFRQHAARLRRVAAVLRDQGIRLGLEYVGPKTSWTASRYPFIHTMAEMKDLIAEIGLDHVGFLLDSWHWHTAQETAADLLTLKASEVVLCHLNDAPAGVPVDQQVDSRRELPCATGVIDTRGFLGSLARIGYEGPVVCEPFSQKLRGLPPEEILATVAAAMKKAAALLEQG